MKIILYYGIINDMDTMEIEAELVSLQKKLQDGTIKGEEESRFYILYKKYIKIIDDEIKTSLLKNTLKDN